MKVVSVEARNFRSYKELVWKLPSRGVALIDGKNLDTGRNNMTGKTTLLDSIFWALYGYLPKWGGPKGGPVDAVIKRGETKCQVQVNVEFAGKYIIVRRERPNKLFVEVDGNEIQGKSGDLDSRIPELIGMTAEQFLTAVYISQDRKQSFFSMGEADRTQLLSEVSKVENINRGMEKARQEKTRIELNIERQKSVIDTLEGQLNIMPNEIKQHEQEILKKQADLNLARDYVVRAEAETAEKIKDKTRDHEYKSKIAIEEYETQKAHNSMHLSEQEMELAVLEANMIRAPQIELNYTQRIEELKQKIKSVEANNYTHARSSADLAIAKAGLNNSLNEIESAQNGKCDHCNQDLPNHIREKHVNEMLDHAKRWEKKIAEVVVPELIDIEPLKLQLNDALTEYTKRKTELEAVPKGKEQEAQTIRMGIQLSRQNLAALERNHALQLQVMQRDLQDAIKNWNLHPTQARDKVRQIEQEIAFIQKNIENVKQRIKDQQSSIEENKIKLLTLNRELDEALDLIDVFKGFRQVCFEDLIARISDRAGQLLALMTDGVYTTRIDQMGETSKGEAKLILKPMITKGGQDVPVDDLSGGARRTVMLAYDVAVAEAVGDANVLFLDEALDGLDHMGKTEAMRLLEEVSQTRSVLVIDHSSEIKSAFNEVIKVTYKDGTSQLEN